MTSEGPNTVQTRLIESDDFPFEFLSSLGERESWRKEINRPIYHLHKWWAKRLGSVFRGIILGCLTPQGSNLEQSFYEKQDYDRVVVLDPFMGSGTTIGEAHKLGCIALGRDINPVACESVRVALGPLDRERLLSAFSQLSATVGERIRQLYRSSDASGRECDVLYYFWVKHIECPHCSSGVDLFPTRIIARNAYPDRKPEVQVCCPGCGDIFSSLNGNDSAICPSCELKFNPHQGSARGATAECPKCSRTFSIADTVRSSANPPEHRLYGKLLLTPDGTKVYLRADQRDIDAYKTCSDRLASETESGHIRLPNVSLSDGFNTRQAINYNYKTWRSFFNDRQLLALGWLQDAIAGLSDRETRDAILLLFSGVLEFNNMFASYKGEGTGAVRHMFSHHILKPERTPIEANVWGTPKSSGSFSSLFKTRLLRALDYRSAPFELAVHGSVKKFFCNVQFSGRLVSEWPDSGDWEPHSVYLSCGSSDTLSLPSGSVDLVVTDPPFFDNVHYSELADFFHVWEMLHPRGFVDKRPSTRDPREVQDGDADSFSSKLRAVFSECRRVLKPGGLLVFTYHHSRAEGWSSLADAVYGAGFSIVNAHPVRSEMSVATPKSQAKEPIQLDVILVCRKREEDQRPKIPVMDACDKAADLGNNKLSRLTSSGLTLSRNDCRVVVFSQFLSTLGSVDVLTESARAVMRPGGVLDTLSHEVYSNIGRCEWQECATISQLSLVLDGRIE